MFTLIRKAFFAFSPKEKIISAAAAIVAIVSGGGLIAIFLVKNTQAFPVSGGEYVEGIIGQPSYINPILAQSDVDKSLVRLIFSNLFEISDKIEVIENNKVWNIRLKEGIRWQDGRKLTSDDVIFTIKAIQNPNLASPLLKNFEGVVAERLSEIELNLSLVAPYAFFENNLKKLYIIPKHIFADVEPTNWRLSAYNLAPVGSGPYEFVSYQKQPTGFIEKYILKASATYFKGKPLIEKFIFRFFKEPNELAKAFDSGQIDGFMTTPASFSRFRRPANEFSFQLPIYYAIFFNQSKNPVLKNIEVREAINLAIKKQLLIDEVLEGRGEIMLGPIHRLSPYYNSELPLTNLAKEKVVEILENAGWSKNEDGIYEKRGERGQEKLELSLSVPSVEFLVKTAEFVKKSLEEVGFKIKIEKWDTERFFDLVIKNRNYEMLIFGNLLSNEADLLNFWHSFYRFHPGLNLSLWNNKKADLLIEKSRRDLNFESRLKNLKEIQELIVSDLPAVFLYSPHYLYITTKNLNGVKGGLILDLSDRFLNVKDWYLNSALILK